MDDSAVQVSRVLFGFAVAYHYIFVPLTIGLIGVIATIDGLAWRSKNPVWCDAGHFWRRYFVLNFAFGLATGYVLRYLLKSYWAVYAHQAAPVFQRIFDAEAALSPWLFGLGVLLAFGRHMPLALRCVVSTSMALAVIAQSAGILSLNAWMQYPVNTTVDTGAGQFMVDDVWALLLNPLLPAKIVHTVGAAYVLGSMFVIALSAVCLLRRQHVQMATASLRVAVGWAFVSLFVTAYAGHASGVWVARLQPAKFAAMEAIWNDEAPESLTLFALPDEAASTNRHALQLPHVLGWLANPDGLTPIKSLATLKAEAESAVRWSAAQPPQSTRMVMSIEHYQRQVGWLSLLGVNPKKATDKDFADAAAKSIPAVTPLFAGFRVMVMVWVVLTGLVTLLAWGMRPKARTGPDARLLWALVCALPLPWIATVAGWIVCEMGRQPWTVMGALATGHSVGHVTASQGALALLGMGTVYAAMLFLNIAWSLRWLRLGPAHTGALPWLISKIKSLLRSPSATGIFRG